MMLPLKYSKSTKRDITKRTLTFKKDLVAFVVLYCENEWELLDLYYEYEKEIYMFPMRMHHSHTDFPCRVISFGCMKLPTVYDMDDISNHNTVYRFRLKCRLIRCAYVQRRIKIRTCIHRMTHRDDSLVKYHLSIYSNNIEIFIGFKIYLCFEMF